MRAPLAVLLLSACTGVVSSQGPRDGGLDASVPPAPDGGQSIDAGPPPDAGAPDASTPPDAGRSMVLTVSGSTLMQGNTPVEVRGAISCCGGGYGWPLFDDAWLSYTQAATVNFLHARLGPFMTTNPAGETDWAPVGGGYVETHGKADLSQFNPAFWARVGVLIANARAHGQWVEIDVADGWAVKHCRAGNNPGYSAWDPGFNLQNENACASAGSGPIAPGSTHERWVRQVVDATGSFDNVLYQDGNEVGLIAGYSPQWTQSIHDLIRDEEALHGFPRHLLGTNSGDADAIALPAVDYVELHQAAPATLDQCGQKPCLVNEYNPNPALTPEQFQQDECTARSLGSWFWYWRHGQTDDQMQQSLMLQAQACSSGGTCGFPQGVPEADFTSHADVDPALGDVVNTVMAALSGCAIDSDCFIGDHYADPQQWFEAVNAGLQAKGYCAGQHELGSTDEIAVSETGCTGLWYGYHVYNYGGMKVVWSPGAARGSWSIVAADCP